MAQSDKTYFAKYFASPYSWHLPDYYTNLTKETPNDLPNILVHAGASSPDCSSAAAEAPNHLPNRSSALKETLKVTNKAKDYKTIGVRFLTGGSLYKVYTYKIRKGAKVFLGQLLIANNAVVAVVEIHPKPQDTESWDYKFITQKIVEL